MALPVLGVVQGVDGGVDRYSHLQMDIFATAIKQVEGWKPGNAQPLDDPALPEPVKRGIRGYS